MSSRKRAISNVRKSPAAVLKQILFVGGTQNKVLQVQVGDGLSML